MGLTGSKLQPSSRVAIVPDPGLGDGLLCMIITENLIRSGHEVVTFSNPLVELRRWFPGRSIEPLPHGPEPLLAFDTVIHDRSGPGWLVETLEGWPAALRVPRERFDRRRTRVQNFAAFCAESLHCTAATPQTGIRAPAGLTARLHRDRIMLHPTSARSKKNWPEISFVRLAGLLGERGLTPVFCVSPSERVDWEHVARRFVLPSFGSIDDLACFAHESGYFIGNDSGPGHLASVLGIPTVTLFHKMKKASSWRPGWAPGEVVVPPFRMPSERLRRATWKHLITPGRVLASLDRLVEADTARPAPARPAGLHASA